MRHWLRVVLYGSAFAPILISAAIVQWLDSGATIDVLRLAIVGFLGTLIGPIVLWWISREIESIPVRFKKIESSDHLIFGFLLSYFAPFIAKSAELTANQLFGGIGGVFLALWLTSTLPVHPLLRLRMYHFYKAESDGGVVYGLITKQKLQSTKIIMVVKPISHNTLLEVT